MASSPVEQAIEFVFPAYQRIVKDRGQDSANIWLYEAGGKFDRFAAFLTNEEKEEVRSLVRGRYNLDKLEVTPEDMVANRPRPQLYDL